MNNQQSSKPKTQKQRRRLTNKKKKFAKPPNLLSAPRMRASYFHLSPCSDTYLKCLVDPFNVAITQACVPDMEVTPSHKFSCKDRGTLSTNALGVAFIVYNPWFPFVDAVNSCNAITTSTLLNTGGIGSGFQFSPAGGVSQNTIQAWPYSPNQFGFGAIAAGKNYFRVVGAGVRIRYTGTEMYRSGRLIPYRSPNNSPGICGQTTAGMNVASLLGVREITPKPVDRKWHSISWIPSSIVYNTASSTNPGNFLIDGYNYSTGVPSNAGWPSYAVGQAIGISVDAYTYGAGIPSGSFEWETIAHYEVVGPQIVDSTPSHSDTEGFSAVRDAAGGLGPQEVGPDYYGRTIEYIRRSAPSWISHMSPAAGEVAKAVLPILDL